MPTNNPRINITFEEDTVKLLKFLAKRAHTSVSGIARKMVLEALERDEDMALSKIAEKRMKEDSGKDMVNHEDFWA